MRLAFLLFILCVFSFQLNAQTPVLMSAQSGYSYTENFSDITNWTNNFASGAGASCWGSVPVNSSGIVGDGVKISTSTAAFTTGTSGGVQRGSGVIQLLSTSTANSCAIDLYLNFSGVNAGNISFDLAQVNNSTGDRDSKLKLFYTLDGITFTEITSTNLPFTARNNVSSSASVSVALPSALNNASAVRLRFYEHSTTTGATPTGSQPKISIDNLVVTAINNSTPCVEPSAQPTSFASSAVGSTTATISFAASSPAADSYLVLLSLSNTLTSNPVDGVAYAIGSSIDDATVVDNSSGNSYSLTGLNPSTVYYIFVFAQNKFCANGPLYNQVDPLIGTFTTTSGILPCVLPVAQPTGLTFSSISARGLQGNFSSSASADEYLVVRSTQSTLTSLPSNATTYNLKDNLGGGVVVSTGAATSFVEDSLNPSTTYYYFIFAANSQNCSNGPVYLTASPLSNSATTLSLGASCIVPVSQPTSLVVSGTNITASGSFTSSADADSYIVLYSTSSALTSSPVNGTSYAIGSVLGNSTVVSNGASTSFFQSGLNAGTLYYFFVFAQNSLCSGGPKYNTVNPLIQTFTTSASATYNYYYGNLHAHSGYSDGNKDNPTYTPANDYAYAKNSLGMDFLGISEHNHSGAGMSLSSWPQGVSQAQAATTSSFVALYGQEWGVISNGGHVLIYGIDSLIGWETNNYQIYVAQSDYLGNNGLFKRLNRNGSAFTTYAHPGSSDYGNISNLSYNPSVDSSIIGCAVESGPAMSTATTYNDYPSSMSYLSYYTKMLSKGYHLGPLMDHDTHYTNFGRANENRLVVLAPSLTKSNLLAAFRARRFYATQDIDTRISFTLNNEVMGSIISGSSAPSISITASDPTAPANATKSIKIMYGIPGSGVSPTQLTSTSTGTLNFTHTALTTGSSAYYYADITINGRRSITAPIWYTKTTAVSNPVITVGSITDFGKVQKNTISSEKTYTVSATGLTGNLTITAPTSFQLSLNSGSGFSSSITLTPNSSGGVSTTIIYVRFSPTGLNVYSNNITHVSSGATTKNVAVSGTSYITASACNSYLWNGVTHTTSGDKTYNTIGSGGLDSVATLRLTINNSSSQTLIQTSCGNYFWNGSTYSVSGTYTWTGTNAAGCDSTINLILTIKQNTASTSSVVACDSYTWNGIVYSASGLYSWLGLNAVGCDSTANLQLTIKNSSLNQLVINSCNSYTWRGVVYTTSGTYSWTGTNSLGCDSTEVLQLTVFNSTSSTINVTQCGGSYFWNGVNYNQSGLYSFSTTTASGCDSVAYLNLTIAQPSLSSSQVTACGSYSWNGTTYSQSGTYSKLLTNYLGCDSTAQIDLTINPFPTTALINSNTAVCSGGTAVFYLTGTDSSSLTYNINGGITNTLLLTPESALIKISNVQSAQTLNLIAVTNSTSGCSVNLNTSSTISIGTVSGNVTWNFNTASPTSVAFANISELTQGNNNGTTILLSTTAASSGYSGASGGNNAGLSARTGALNTGSSGSAYFTFTVNGSNSGSFTLTGISFGSRSTTTGPQLYSLRSSIDNYASNIDTGFLLNTGSWIFKSRAGLNISGTSVTFRIYGSNGTGSAAANTANWRIDDLVLSFAVSGTYATTSATGNSQLVCDSLVSTSLGGNIPQVGVGEWTQVSGPGTTDFTNVNYGNTSATASTFGLYTYRWTISNSCNSSISQADITVNYSNPYSIQNIQACDSFVWNGVVYRNSVNGVIYNTTSYLGCDSTAMLNLTLYQSVSTHVYDTVCTSSLPYNWNGNYFTASGIYTSAFTNVNGCDSLVILHLKVDSCFVTLNLKLLIEGYYLGSGLMRNLLYQSGLSTNALATDSIQVALWRADHLQNVVPDYSAEVMLINNGNTSLILPGWTTSNSYYIAIKHRNSIETWSKLPVLITAVTNYDFTTAQSKAYDNGVNPPMRNLGDGRFAFISGDLNQDGGIDMLDLSETENDAAQALTGYQTADCTGNGIADLNDLIIVEDNAAKFIYYARPY